MKRIIYNGEALVTGTDVADGLVHYLTHVASMTATIALDVPVLEENGSVQPHTLILSTATQLEIMDIDGMPEAEEGARFPVPEFPPVGGQAFAVAAEDIQQDAPLLDEDPVNSAAFPDQR
jgi:hypothetical protein